MALMDYGYMDPSRVAEREEEAKKREAWLDEEIPINMIQVHNNAFDDSKSYVKFLIKRRELIVLINSSGALDSIRDSCYNADLQNMRF